MDIGIRYRKRNLFQKIVTGPHGRPVQTSEFTQKGSIPTNDHFHNRSYQSHESTHLYLYLQLVMQSSDWDLPSLACTLGFVLAIFGVPYPLKFISISAIIFIRLVLLDENGVAVGWTAASRPVVWSHMYL